jgi:hypothetical protein
MGKEVLPWIYARSTPYPTKPTVSYAGRTSTRLGLVGETTKGPAFQPLLVKNVTEFTNMFGNPSQYKDEVTGFPRYELPYIANSFLTESDSLFVTRVLGLCGYDAGYTWAITLDGNYDVTTQGVTITGGTYPTLFVFTADSNSNVTQFVTSDSLLQSLWSDRHMVNVFNNLPGLISSPTDFNYTAGTLSNIPPIYAKISNEFTGLSINNFYLTDYKALTGGSIGSEFIYYTGQTSGITIYHSGSTYHDIDDLLVTTIKSRATYDDNESLSFRIGGGVSSLSFDQTVSGATNDVYGDFKLKWVLVNGTTGSTTLSFDVAKNNYIGRVLDYRIKSSPIPIYIDELYIDLIRELDSTNNIKGLKLSLVEYDKKFSNYKDKFKPSVTPWVVSQIKGSNITRLFRLWSKGDGEYTTDLFKVTISNIYPYDSSHWTGGLEDYDVNQPDKYHGFDFKFDVTIRDIDNRDSSFKGFENEVFKNCSMNPKSANYIGKMIGTKNGDYPSKSNYTLVEINDEEDLSLLFPAGFVGYPTPDYDNTSIGTAKPPYPMYKKIYDYDDIIENTTLGLSNFFGYDKSMFSYKGVPDSTTINQWTGMTKGFHMDINATGATIDNVKLPIGGNKYYSPNYEFEVGNAEFTDEQYLTNTQYDPIETRKFTFMPYGGFDGWDIHRLGRTNTNTYKVNGIKGILGEASGNFDAITLTNKDVGLTSDYYAFLEGINTFTNTDYININLFATPGIDVLNHNDLVEYAIDFIEFNRADSLYIVTTPDLDVNGDMLDYRDVVTAIEGTYNTSYAATYWPWVNISNIWLPPTISVVTSMAKNDITNKGTWIANAGMSRGDIKVNGIRLKDDYTPLTKTEISYLYANRINPLIYSNLKDYVGYKIWGNKTLSLNGTLTNRIHVRRLLLEVRQIIISTCKPYLFEQNDSKVKRDIENKINPILKSIKDRRGISEFKLKFDTTVDEMDKGQLNGKLFLKPVGSIEYIVFNFSIEPTDNELVIAFDSN